LIFSKRTMVGASAYARTPGGVRPEAEGLFAPVADGQERRFVVPGGDGGALGEGDDAVASLGVVNVICPGQRRGHLRRAGREPGADRDQDQPGDSPPAVSASASRPTPRNRATTGIT
jgi:hypothetical protein